MSRAVCSAGTQAPVTDTAARRALRAIGGVVAAALGMTALLPSAPANAAASSSRLAIQIHDKALTMLGTEYVFGRNDDQAVDCSALMQQIFASAGIRLPRTVHELLHTGAAVSRTHVHAGDLMIYRWQPHQLHVALVLDGGHIEHASPSAGEVVVVPLNTVWRQHLIAVRRILKS